MKNFCISFCALVAFLLTDLVPSFAQTPAFAWANQIGGTNESIGKAIAVDGAGNSYVTGYFKGTATFGNITLSSSGFEEMFTVKYDASGTVVWAVKGGGSGNDNGNGIAVDNNGNIYVTGHFGGTASFGNVMLSSNGSQDMYIVKYNAQGVVVWAVKSGGTQWDEGFSIAVDGSGNSYVTGMFRGNATFGSYSLSSSTGSYDMFTAKYNASGAVAWAVKGGGSDTDKGLGIAVDASGNSYVIGVFEGTATFGNTTFINTSARDIFTIKFNAQGSVVWVVQGGGTSTMNGKGIAVDSNGNIYITGSFMGNISFGSFILSSSGDLDIFTVKYDASGTVTWAEKCGGTGWDSGSAIAVDINGNCYVTGHFTYMATFGTTILTGAGVNGALDMFTVKYNTLGTIAWVAQGGGTENEFSNSIALDGNDNAYVTGNFMGTAAFGTTSLNTGMVATMFTAKLGSGTTTGVPSVSLSATAIIYPNPNNGMFNLEIKSFRQEKAILTAYDVNGKQIKSKEISAINGTFTEKLLLPNQGGIYLLKIVSDQQILTRKIIVK